MKLNCITAAITIAVLISLNTRGADELAALCADRAAVERVYYQHRTGEKPPFEQVLPAEVIWRAVERDRQREAALRKIYAAEITGPQLDAELKRIEANTRAPEILAELKRALGGDAARFARTVARPALIERELRARFENDDRLHASVRRECESLRERCLKLRSTGRGVREIVELLKQCRTAQVSEYAWELGTRDEPVGNSRDMFRPHFDELPAQLRQVLADQLRQPGDISATIEMPDKFLLFVCTSRTTAQFDAASLSIPKLNLETWLSTLPQP
jgi:hypothetical protein